MRGGPLGRRPLPYRSASPPPNRSARPPRQQQRQQAAPPPRPAAPAARPPAGVEAREDRAVQRGRGPSGGRRLTFAPAADSSGGAGLWRPCSRPHRGRSRQFVKGSAGLGDPVLPSGGERGLRRPHYGSRSATRRKDRPRRARGQDQGDRHRGAQPLRPRPSGPGGHLRAGGREKGRLSAQGPGARDHATPWPARGRAVQGPGAVPGPAATR